MLVEPLLRTTSSSRWWSTSLWPLPTSSLPSRALWAASNTCASSCTPSRRPVRRPVPCTQASCASPYLARAPARPGLQQRKAAARLPCRPRRALVSSSDDYLWVASSHPRHRELSLSDSTYTLLIAEPFLGRVFGWKCFGFAALAGNKAVASVYSSSLYQATSGFRQYLWASSKSPNTIETRNRRDVGDCDS